MKEYTYDKLQLMGMFGVGILGVLMFFASDYPSFVYFLPLVMAFLLLAFKPIKLCEEHLEFKNHPIRITTMVKYSDISGIDNRNDKEIVIHKKDGKKEKMKLKTIDSEYRSEVVSILRSKITGTSNNGSLSE